MLAGPKWSRSIFVAENGGLKSDGFEDTRRSET